MEGRFEKENHNYDYRSAKGDPSNFSSKMDRPLCHQRNHHGGRQEHSRNRHDDDDRRPRQGDPRDRRHHDDRRARSRSREQYDRHRRDDRRDDPREDRRDDRREEHHAHRHHSNNNVSDFPKHKKVALPEYRITNQVKDGKLSSAVAKDPRGDDPNARITKKKTAVGRNTESFDPASTLVRPDLRVHVGSVHGFNKTLKHDDVVIVPELFGREDDWDLYYKLVEEMTQLQKEGNSKGAEWISWHEGAHLISKNPVGSPTFQKIIDKLCEYFNIRKESIGTRFNWYKDSSDWKPFHHDSAAFNPQRAKNQNITVGVSFGATRELAFIRAAPLPDGDKLRVYFPQTNNGVFSFGRDANILWKHGINALAPDDQDGKGRISIILWGLAQSVKDENGSPPLLGSDGKGPHAAQRKHQQNRGGNKKRNNRRRR